MNLENKSLRLLIVLWTLSISINCISNVDHPEISPTDSDISLNVNSNFTLNCTSNDPITWRTGIFDQLESLNATIKTQAGQYIATIYLQNISAQHVGRYFCVKEIALLDVPFYKCDTPNVTCINIFVNDPNVHLVPIEGYAIDVTSQDIITIPCKPTKHDIEVELIRPNGQVLNGSFENNELQTNDISSFDKYVGFKLRIQNIRDEGLYICRPKFPSTSNLEETTSFYVFFEDDFKEDFAARIISIPSAHALLGETFILKCFVDMDPNSGFAGDIVWEMPNQMETENRSLVTHEGTFKKTSPKVDTFFGDSRSKARFQKFYRFINQSVLTITNSQISDQGYFNCSLRDRPDSFIKKASYYVKHLRNGEIFFDDTNSPKNFTFLRNMTMTAELFVHFQSLLQLEFQWTAPKGKRIGGVYGEKFAHFSNELSSYMQIKNVSVEDTGEYICTAANKLSTKTVKLWVDIKGEPQIFVARSYYVQIGQELELSVKTIANPDPTLLNIKWSFIKCPFLWKSIKGLCEGDPVNLGKFRIKFNKTNDFTTIFGLVIKPEIPGEIRFKIANGFGTALGKSFVSISDIPGNISIIGIDPEHEISEGDEVIMKCAAQRSLFELPIWLRNNNTISNIGEVKVSMESSKFSYRRILKFNNITKQDAGEYICRGTMKDTLDEITESVNIIVYEPEAPVINETNMEDAVERFVDQFLQLICKATGKPKPTITWYKDDEEINQNPNVDLFENNSILRIQSVNSSDTGVYKCWANNRLGSDSKSLLVEIKDIAESSNRKTVFAIIGGIAVVTILVISFSFYIYKMKKNLQQSVFNNFEEGAIDQLDPNLSLDEQADLLPYNRCYEFPRNRLKLGKQLGAGAFGVVLQGLAQRIIENEEETVVAVKKVKRNADHEVLKALVSELKIMVHLGQHLNVVNLLGAVTENKSEIMIIVEYCPYGCVQNVLLHNRKWFVDQIDPINDKIDCTIPNEIYSEHSLGAKSNSSSFNCDPTERIILSTSDLVSWAFQVARGMDYLSSRRILHRDLAARNILLCKDNVVKICDFGLSKSMYKNDNYKKQTDTPLPIKWLALESLADQVYNALTDVWSFGITLWEFFSLATVPYPGMDANHEFFTKLRNGYRMEKPPYANQAIYDIMLECWNEDPEQRPLFNELEMKFSKLLDEEVTHHYINLNEPHVQWNTEYQKKIELNYLTIMGTDNEACPMISSPMYANELLVPDEEKNPPDSCYLPMVSFNTTRNKGILRQFDDGYVKPDRHVSIEDKIST